MKTKLLRKIRKQYSIVYYPRGIECFFFGSRYFIHKGEYYVSRKGVGVYLKTKNECLDYILNRVREKYGRKKGIKVWYNGK